MEDLRDKIERVLKERFEGARIELERAAPLEKVGGFLVWDGFADVEQIERQRQVWDELRARLDRSEQLQVSAILTATPEEVSVVPEDTE